MPLFPEGQDPLDVASGTNEPGRMPLGQAPPDPWAAEPSQLDTITAAFRQNNPIVSVLSVLSRSRPDMTPEPGYDPVKRLSGTKDDDLIEQSLADVNPAQTDARIAQKNDEIKDQQTLAASGWPGTVASVVAGATDPSWFIPIAGELHAAEGLGMAVRAGRGMAEGAVRAGISESALQASQVTRTPSESGANIATNSLLMGLIGGGLGMLAPAERAGANKGLEATRTDLSAPDLGDRGLTLERSQFSTTPGYDTLRIMNPSGNRVGLATINFEDPKNIRISHIAADAEGQPFGVRGIREIRDELSRLYPEAETVGGFRVSGARKSEEYVEQSIKQPPEKVPIVPDGQADAKTLASSLSAAAADTRTMQLSRILLPDNWTAAIKATPVLGQAYDYASKVLMNFSPTLRIFSSASLVAKRAMGDLAETSLRFTQADSGITSARGGIPVDRLVKMQAHEGQLTASQILRDSFIDYRGLADAKLPTAQATLQDLRGQAPGKLSYDDFKSEVSAAMTNGDVHGVPQVAAAAKQIRAQVLDPVTRLAQRTIGPDGRPMLAEELAPPKGDKSFFPRVWNKRALTADFNRATRTFADWLESEQGIKAAAKDRLQLYQTALELHHDTIDALEARLEARTGRLEDLQSRQEEISRLNKFAYQRSAELSEPLDAMRARIRTITTQIQPQLDRLAQLAEDIKAEKVKFPEIKEADALIFKMIGAAQKLKQSKEIVDSVEAAGEYSKAVGDVIAGFRGGIREASEQAKLARRELGADDLVALEKSRADVTKEIKPFLQELRKVRKNLREEAAAKAPVARGGAVFETKIRGRGNQLADQASGKAAEIEKIEQQLIDEHGKAKVMRDKIEKEIADWQGDTTAEAKAALKVRAEAEKARTEKIAAGEYEGRGERFTSADNAVDRAVKSIIKSDRDLSRQELEERAREILNRLKDAPDGRLPYDAPNGGPAMGPPGERQQLRGSLNARDFAIPTSLVKDWVNTDAEHVIATHLRTVLPDIHLTDRFGDVEMTNTFKALNEEYDKKLTDATTAKQQTAIDNERRAMIRDLAASRDRVRNVYGWELASTQPNAARIANVARNWNLLTDLGTSVFNRLNDSTNAVWRHGLMNVFGDGYIPFFKSMIGLGDGFATAARQSMRDMGVGVDSAIGHMSHQWGDIIDNNMPGNKFERALAWSAQKSMVVNLHGPWTDGMKTIAGTVAGAEFLRTAQNIAGGTHTAVELSRMAQAGIDVNMATRIWKAYSEGGGQEFGKGTHVANTADWTDIEARDVFRSAIARSADQAVLTPGLEKPLWMSSPVVSLLGQYKSFIAAAHEKILISNLQQMDGRTLQGLVAALGMGMISYRAYTLWSGTPTSDRPQDWIKEAVSRSAMLSWFTEINAMQAKFTGGSTDAFRAIGADHPLSRRQSNSALSELLGPTYARLEGMAGGVNDAFHGTWTAMDTHKFRQAIWLQNLFAVRRLLDKAEDGFNEHIGVKPLNRDPAAWPGVPQIQMQ